MDGFLGMSPSAPSPQLNTSPTDDMCVGRPEGSVWVVGVIPMDATHVVGESVEPNVPEMTEEQRNTEKDKMVHF
jgi:hypothetical protein